MPVTIAAMQIIDSRRRVIRWLTPAEVIIWKHRPQDEELQKVLTTSST